MVSGRVIDSSRTRDNAWLGTAVAVAIILFLFVHFIIGLNAPLWLDESWTGALAALNTFDELLHQAGEEAGGPLYYIFIWFWAKLFGISNASFHSSSLLFAVLAPLIAWRGLRTCSQNLALAWAIILIVWGPGMAQSGFARCYPLLSCLIILMNVTFIKLLIKPTIGKAFVWSFVSSAAILTHYYASIICCMQGVYFLALHRRRMLDIWPSASLFFVPMGWIFFHQQRLTMMASPEYSWYRLIDLGDIPVILSYLLGFNIPMTVCFIAVLCSCHIIFRKGYDRHTGSIAIDRAVIRAGIATIFSVSILVCIAMIRPCLTLRYLTPFEPGCALLIAYWLCRIIKNDRRRLAGLLVGFISLSSVFWLGPLPLGERIFNFEVASKWIGVASPSATIFFWDNPVASTVASDQLKLVGGFFLHRNGINTTVYPIYPKIGTDMNGLIEEKLKVADSSIWMYDTWVLGTTAKSYPPLLGTLEPSVECKNFGLDRIGIFACRRKISSS